MNWPFIVAVLVCSGFVQGLTGFGFGLVSMSLLPAVLGVKQAAALSTIYALLVTIATFIRHYHDYNWRLGFPFLVSCCVGVPIGVYFLEKSSEGLLLKILGAFMVAFAAREFLVKRPLESISNAASVPFGLFSGSLSGAFNLGGIPTAIYAYAHAWTQGQIMAFLQVMLVTSCALRLVFYNKFGYFTEFSWTYGLIILLPLYTAMMAGHRLMTRIPPKKMRKGIFVFIGVAGLYYLFLHEEKVSAQNLKTTETSYAYSIKRTAVSPINLDLESAGWSAAPIAEVKNFRPESSAHRPQTSVRLLYDDKGIHGLFQVRDQYVRSIRTNYMDEVWKDSCVEFFIRPKADKGYFNFEFNAGGAFLCCYIIDWTRSPNLFKDFARVPEALAKNVKVTSSLPKVVDPEITEPLNWTLQFFIPFSLLEEYVGPIGNVAGQTWTGNFFKCVEQNSHPHWASWSPVDEFNFHLPRCFGSIRFG